MKVLPKSIVERRELNLRQGIKSSLSSIRSIIALVYTLYRGNNRKAVVEYSESTNGGQIKLHSTLENSIKTFLGIDDLTSINNNPLFKSQMEALQVGIELIFKLGKVEFIDSTLASSAERTGGNRYNKRIRFGTNIQIVDTFLSSYEADLSMFLRKWLQNQESEKREIDDGIKKLLTIFSEETQFKIRYNNQEISFQQEGIYKEFASGNTVVGRDEHENVGPFRVFKSYVKEGLHPYISENGDEFTAKNTTTDALEYYQIVSNALDLIPRRTQITSFVSADHELEDNAIEETSKSTEARQIIYYGCPGSGKSHMVNKLVNSTFTKYLSSKGLSDSSCSKYANVLTTQWVVDIAKQCTTENIESLYDISDIETINKVFNDKVFNEKDDKGQRMYSTALKHYIDYLDTKKYIFRTTFHPDTDYASFVGCYKPMAEGHNGNYRFKSLQDLKAEANIINSSSGDKVSQIVAFVTKYANDLQYIVDTDPNIKSLQNLLNKNLSFANETYLAYVVDYVLKNQETRITYKFCPQVFTNAYIKAWEDTSKPVYLIIEEINRGNCAQIFGDLFQLLDRDKVTGKSEYPIKADKDLVAHIEKVLGAGHERIKNGELCLPSNLIIYATMNTSDQSLFPMDSAFKRRWDWEYVPINYSKDIDSGKFVIEIDEHTKYSWVEFLESVNDKIYDATNSEDKQMGNFFIKKSIKANEFVNKVMFYLWNEVCKEEYGTQRNFFRKGKDGKTEFKFTDLFGDNQATILKEFMTSLGVEPIGKKTEEPAAE